MAKKKLKPIKYTTRDFNSIKSDLVSYAKRYYPDTFRDFNEASFGALMLDTVSYVGDILSFYLDYQVNETFLDTASEYNNVVKLCRQLGYKFQANPSSIGHATFYIIVAANSTGLSPDPAYIPKLLKGSEFSSDSGNSFTLDEDVLFEAPNNEIAVAEVDSDTGLPTSYAIKVKGRVKSGVSSRELIDVEEFVKFRRVKLDADDVAEIISVVDSEGHQYYEVDYLSQNVLYKAVPNTGANSKIVQSILKPYIVPRRFVVERNRESTYIQFGYGSDSEITSQAVVDPSNIVLNMHGRDFISDKSFDPSKLLSTDKFGVGPANTTLTIDFRVNSANNVNIAANTLTTIEAPLFKFKTPQELNTSTMNDVMTSLEVDNDQPIIGDVSIPSAEELRRRAMGNFATQNRAVTQQDYTSLVYSMPGRFGAIKRCNIIRDPDSMKRNMNLYVISENTDGTLIKTNETIKNNLKTWLNKSRMLNDTIDILDAKIVNFGIEFIIAGTIEKSNSDILRNAIINLRDHFLDPPDMSEDFYITDIYKVLQKTNGVLDVIDVKVIQKKGGSHSDTRFDLEQAMSADGRYIVIPENVVWEIKFPSDDIIGTVK